MPNASIHSLGIKNDDILILLFIFPSLVGIFYKDLSSATMWLSYVIVKIGKGKLTLDYFSFSRHQENKLVPYYPPEVTDF